MKIIAFLFGLVFTQNIFAETKADPNILVEYYMVLTREVFSNERKEYVSNFGVPIHEEFRDKDGNIFYVVASDIPKYGCFYIVFSYNEAGMNFLCWKQRMHSSSSAIKSIERYRALDGKDFSFDSEP